MNQKNKIKKRKNIHSKVKDNYEDLFELQYNNPIAKANSKKKKYYQQKKYRPNADNDPI